MPFWKPFGNIHTWLRLFPLTKLIINTARAVACMQMVKSNIDQSVKKFGEPKEGKLMNVSVKMS